MQPSPIQSLSVSPPSRRQTDSSARTTSAFHVQRRPANLQARILQTRPPRHDHILYLVPSFDSALRHPVTYTHATSGRPSIRRWRSPTAKYNHLRCFPACAVSTFVFLSLFASFCACEQHHSITAIMAANYVTVTPALAELIRYDWFDTLLSDAES